MKRHLLMGAAVVVVGVLSGPRQAARADGPPKSAAADETHATELYGVARERFDAGDYPAALDAIDKSLAALDSPNSELLRGHILRGMGRKLDAMNAYERTLAGAKRRLLAGETRFEPTAAEAGRWMGLLGAELAELDVSIVGASPEVKVLVGGAPVAIETKGESATAHVWVDPGDLVVEVIEGSKRDSRKLSAGAGSSHRFLFDLRPKPALPPATTERAEGMPPAGAWVAAGIGFAGMTAFAILGGLALSADAELADSCSPRCPASRLDEAERGERLQIGANVSAAIGAAGLAAGAVIWIVDAAIRSDGETTPALRPDGRGLVVRF